MHFSRSHDAAEIRMERAGKGEEMKNGGGGSSGSSGNMTVTKLPSFGPPMVFTLLGTMVGSMAYQDCILHPTDYQHVWI